MMLNLVRMWTNRFVVSERGQLSAFIYEVIAAVIVVVAGLVIWALMPNTVGSIFNELVNYFKSSFNF